MNNVLIPDANVLSIEVEAGLISWQRSFSLSPMKEIKRVVFSSTIKRIFLANDGHAMMLGLFGVCPLNHGL
ncbi:hypothetical protein G5S52_15390 [Grimontia sp. S25]|uniref:Uncharacterized protein n=1 Tax=Grimontia sedimenti TaxID=2711294 RepID=A0A6M1RFN8_9GAMM|nr:hypothetical protein [Grimontia sedimenti]NGN98984.1 hypothetical protein [Grimontia sedimenti]